MRKKIVRRGAKALCLEQAALVEQHQRFVQINERRPEQILVAHEHVFRLGEQLDGLKRLPGPARGNRGKGKGFRPFVAKPQVLKRLVRGSSQFPSFRVQVQIEINFRQVQIAKRQLVAVFCLFRARGGIAKHMDGTAKLASQKIQVGDIVVGIRDQDRHAFLLAVLARDPVEFQCLGKVIQADVAQRQVAEYGRQTFCVIVLQQFLVRTLVKFYSFREPILPVVNVPDINFQPRHATCVALLQKDLAPAFPGR